MECPLSARTLFLRLTLLLAVAPILSHQSASAAEIRVPADCASIQVAIDAAAEGDIIIVSPGIYVDNIDFKGRAIVLTSIDSSDAGIVESTIIDANQADAGVLFQNNELPSSILRGFTITNGKSASFTPTGSGITCLASSPFDSRLQDRRGSGL